MRWKDFSRIFVDPLAPATTVDAVVDAPVPLAGWEDGPAVAVAFLRRPPDGTLRLGVALGERRGGAVDLLAGADGDPWEDAAAQVAALAAEPTRLVPFALQAVELDAAPDPGRPLAAVTWGLAHPAVHAVAVAGPRPGRPVPVASASRVFVAGCWLSHGELDGVPRLALRGLDASGAVVADLPG
ncbi:hypothetical protein [Patulibacter sp. SYSU D01012]|uniref:hypothetical protein n=1 Tax=Patulibacter sp. SYSU D01012 TaxID=2817381 RepID=UPI001B308D72|nr:hypothetical protein [Patulibacter sp. SYSU D01012]